MALKRRDFLKRFAAGLAGIAAFTRLNLQIKGNVEFDRLTLHAYDYLNFIPFYFENLTQRHVDMPGVEVLEELRTPLLIDAYAHEQRYQGFQLYQRGVHWMTFKKS